MRVGELHLRQRVVQLARAVRALLALDHLEDRPHQLDGQARVGEVADLAGLVERPIFCEPKLTSPTIVS